MEVSVLTTCICPISVVECLEVLLTGVLLGGELLAASCYLVDAI